MQRYYHKETVSATCNGSSRCFFRVLPSIYSKESLTGCTCFLVLSACTYVHISLFKRVNSVNTTTPSPPPQIVLHTAPNALCIGPVSELSWSLVDNTAEVHVSKASWFEGSEMLTNFRWRTPRSASSIWCLAA